MHAELIDRAAEVAAVETLLAEFARDATARGVRVVSGHASQRRQDVPFAAVAEVIIGLLRPAAGQPAMPYAIGRDLAALLAQSPSSRRGWRQLYAAVRVAVDLTAGRNGLVVLLDDLHWADHGTVELLGYLLRHPCSAGVDLIAAYQPRQVAGRLATALAAAGDAGRALRFEAGCGVEVVDVISLGVADAGAPSEAFLSRGGAPR
ncbi:MAG: ATP-binding protein [Pseudonocardiaceae bacterium]